MFMQPAVQDDSISKGVLWTSRVLSWLPALFILSSGINLLFVQSADVRQSFARFGYSEGVIRPIGFLECLCAVTYLNPRTAILGAILLTGYLGGAVATHVRVSDPVGVVPFVLGVLLWLALYLRNPQLRSLVPFMK
jgi:hypothetical protein